MGNATAVADVDGDGYDDIVIAYPNTGGVANSYSNAGVVMIKRGSATASVPSTTLYVGGLNPTTHPVDYEIHGASSNMKLQYVTTGDIDGDGYADILISENSNADRTHIYFGRPVGPTAGVDWSDSANSEIGTTNLHFSSIDPSDTNNIEVKDVNADGKADVLIGDHEYSSSKGQACLFLGRTQAAWAALATLGAIPITAADLCIRGKEAGDQLGRMVALGNFDGAGTLELTVGIPNGDGINNSGTDTGEVGVLWWSLPTNYSNLIFDVTPEF
jgi:hypothetical protein